MKNIRAINIEFLRIIMMLFIVMGHIITTNFHKVKFTRQ